MSRNKFVKGHARIKIKPELSGSSVAAFLKRDGIALFYLSDSGATGLCGESDFFNRGIMALPCQQQALCIAVAHPVGGKFRWQNDVQFAADRIESGQGDRFDPLAKNLGTQITAQSATDHMPRIGQTDSDLFF